MSDAFSLANGEGRMSNGLLGLVDLQASDQITFAIHGYDATPKI